MDAEHDPRERDGADDQGGRDDGGDAAAARQEAEGDQQEQAAADRRPQRMAGRERHPGRRRDRIRQHRAGPADDLLQREAERGAAEDRDDKPRRVVPFAVDQVHQRNHRERDAEHVRVEDVADDLGRPHQLRMSGVDPVERLRGAGVETAQRRPARADEQQEQRERDRGDERADQTRAEPQPEALVGGGQMAVDSPPQPLRHAFSRPPDGGSVNPGLRTRLTSWLT